MDLYEPIDTFRELGLLVMDWGADNRWRPTSDEGKLLWWVAVEGPIDQPIGQANSSFLWV